MRVVRARRQAFTIDISGAAADDAENVDVILGVNGYIWISRHIEVKVPPRRVVGQESQG